MVIFIGFFVSCKGTIVEEPVIVPQPEILLPIATPATVKYNGSSTVSWQLKNAKSCDVSVNGVLQTVNGNSIDVKNLISNATVVITAIGDGSYKSSTTVNISVENAPAPSVSITAPTDVIPFASSTTFSWVLGDYTTGLSIDGVNQTGTSFKTPVLTKSTDYNLVAIGPGGTQSYKITINVDSYKNSKLGLITYKPWYLVKEEQQQVNSTTWYPMIPDPRTITDHLVFGVDGKLRYFDVNEVLIGGPYDWYFTDLGLQVVKGTTYSSVSVTENQMVLIATVSGFGVTITVRDTYEHK